MKLRSFCAFCCLLDANALKKMISDSQWRRKSLVVYLFLQRGCEFEFESSAILVAFFFIDLVVVDWKQIIVLYRGRRVRFFFKFRGGYFMSSSYVLLFENLVEFVFWTRPVCEFHFNRWLSFYCCVCTCSASHLDSSGTRVFWRTAPTGFWPRRWVLCQLIHAGKKKLVNLWTKQRFRLLHNELLSLKLTVVGVYFEFLSHRVVTFIIRYIFFSFFCFHQGIHPHLQAVLPTGRSFKVCVTRLSCLRWK